MIASAVAHRACTAGAANSRILKSSTFESPRVWPIFPDSNLRHALHTGSALLVESTRALGSGGLGRAVPQVHARAQIQGPLRAEGGRATQHPAWHAAEATGKTPGAARRPHPGGGLGRSPFAPRSRRPSPDRGRAALRELIAGRLALDSDSLGVGEVGPARGRARRCRGSSCIYGYINYIYDILDNGSHNI